MDCISIKDQEIIIDIDNFIESSKELGTRSLSQDKIGDIASFSVCGILPLSVDEIVGGESSPNLSSNQKNKDGVSSGLGQNSKREKHKSISGKKPPKPPRPPRGLSLDPADQKLIKEISELAMIKRARAERMKALKKMKASNASSTSSGSLMAMVFTVVFFIVVILQGCHSSGISPRNKSGSLDSSGVIVKDQWNVINSGVPLTSVESPNATESVARPDSKIIAGKAIH